MNARQLRSELKSGVIGRLYLFDVEDEHVGRFYLKALRDACVPEDALALSCNVFSEKKTEPGLITSTLRTLPVASPLRFVCLEQDAWQKNDAAAKELAAYAASPAASSVLVLYARPADKRSSVYKTFSREGRIVQIPRATQKELGEWISSDLAARGLKITPEALSFFIVSGDYLSKESKSDSGYYAAELQKIALAAKSKTVDLAAVERVVSRSQPLDLFGLSDSVVSGKTSQALSKLAALASDKPASARIMWELARTMRNIAMCQALERAGSKASDIASSTGLHPFAVKKALDAAPYYGLADALGALKCILAAERAVKTGTASLEDALFMLTADLSEKTFILSGGTL